MNPGNAVDSSSTQSILVTDSGLGGLSVFNDIANRLEKGSPWQKVKLIYFNSWPAPHRGYNHYDTKEKKEQVFNNALYAMDEYQPDRILIACNTLSVIYPNTRFSNSSGTLVEGIVDHGVKMIYEKLTGDPDSVAVIFGTPTTIDARSHENALANMGIERDRIINIGCTDLAGWIERQPFSDTVNQMIREYVKTADTELGNFNGRIYAALCCTHFAYRQTLFEQAFTEILGGKVTVLNPNIRMAHQVFECFEQIAFLPTRVDLQIVSKAIWEDEQIEAYLRLLADISPSTRNALENYERNDQLFSVD